MNIWNYFDERTKRLGILDTKLAMGAVMCVAVVIIKLFPEIMDISGWWFVVGAGLFAIKPMIMFFGPSPKA